MIFLLFCFIDLLTAFVMVGAQLGFISNLWLFYHSSYLIFKGGWYWRDPLSWIDIAIGAYMLLMILGLRSVLSYVFAAFLLYKFLSWVVLR